MGSLANKRILLGITGGIAAYKSVELARRLVQAGAQVRVIMTRAAMEFITPLTLQAVSGHAVHSELLDEAAERGMGHIQLARWADALVIAPASANCLAKLAHGRADDLLSTVALATAAPVALAPAMNQQMWHNAATQENLQRLRAHGLRLFGPAQGEQACGEVGPGRMLEASELLGLTAGLFDSAQLAGVRVLVTAGPTWEALDPVRGLTNHSSGKMGYAMAAAAAEAGAKVTLISGPTHLPDPERLETQRVLSAQSMYDAVMAQVSSCDIFIAVAAVADYRPAEVRTEKMKKDASHITLELVRNPDILASVAAHSPRPYCVGFAAETHELENHARGKLHAKAVDMIIANHVGTTEGGFEADDNRVIVMHADGVHEFPLQHKSRLARELIQHIARHYETKNSTQDTRHTHRQ